MILIKNIFFYQGDCFYIILANDDFVIHRIKYEDVHNFKMKFTSDQNNLEVIKSLQEMDDVRFYFNFLLY